MPHNACRIRNDPKRQYNYYTLSEGKLQKSSKKRNDVLACICSISGYLERLRVINLVRKSREKLEIML